MSVQRALLLLSAQKRALGVVYSQFFRSYSFYAKEPFRPKPVSLNQQSVLLPGKERIRSSVLLDDPTKLVHEIPGSPEVQTVYDCLSHGQKVSNDGPCIGSKNPASGQYEWQSYSEVMSRAQAIGSGLIQLGLKPQNDSFMGMFAVNQEEFLITLYGCAAYSMVLVPLYLTLGLESVLYVMNQACLSVVIVNSEENSLKVLRNLKDLPNLKSLVIMDPITPLIQKLAKQGNINLLQFSGLEELGRNSPQDLVLPKPDDLFCIPYTSGTTGIPKGVMMTHRGIIACVACLKIGYGEAGMYGGTILSYLPPAHIYEICNEVVSLYFARRIAFYSGDLKKLMDDVRILKPEILPLVPRLMNVLYTKVKESVEGSALKSFLLRTALSRKEKLLKRGKVTNQSIWDKLVLKKFQEALGGNVHMIITTSAPLSPEVMSLFRCGSGAYVFEVYGQTETMSSSMTLPLEYEGGSLGGPVACNFMKLEDVPEMGYFSKDDFGEVCMKGPNVFIGYFKNEKATKEGLIDGWQHSGDIGRWLPNGALKIVDRKKHLFKLSQGEYIAPEKVETVYSQSQLVGQIFVDGHSDQNYTIALVFPEPSALKGWLRSKGYKESEDINQLLSKKEVRKSFLMELRKIGEGKDLNGLEQAKNLAFLSEPLSVENDLMSPTLKVRRVQARKHFESLFDSLYKEGPLV